MSGSLVTRAHLQKQLLNSFEQETKQLSLRLQKNLSAHTSAPLRTLAHLQQVSIEQGSDSALEKLKQGYGLSAEKAESLQAQINLLNHLEHETLSAHQGLQHTKRRRRQKQ